MGKNLFHELRYDLNGNLKNDFILNWDYYKDSVILVTGENFGCGSSRNMRHGLYLTMGLGVLLPQALLTFFLIIVSKMESFYKIRSKRYRFFNEEAENKKLISVDLEKQQIISEKII